MSINTLTDDYFKPWLNARVNDLTVDGNFNYNPGSNFTNIVVQDKIKRTYSSVTQTGSITNSVTCNSPCGVITTVNIAGTVAPYEIFQFQVSNSYVDLGDIVHVSVHNQGVAGNAYAVAENIQNGLFDIVVYNAATISYIGQITISFRITSQL